MQAEQSLPPPAVILNGIGVELMELNKRIRVIQEYGPSTGRAEYVSRIHMLDNDLVKLETLATQSNNPGFGFDMSRLYYLRSIIDGLLVIVNHFVVGLNKPFTRKYFMVPPVTKRAKPKEKHTVVRFNGKLYQVHTKILGVEVTYRVTTLSGISFWVSVDIDLDVVF